MNTIFNQERFWCGTEESLAAFVAENKHFLATNPVQPVAAAYDPNASDQPIPRLLSMQGNVAVVSVQGSLVNSSSWVNEYYGRSGYPEIRDALISAASNPDVKAIVLDIKSGGGSVSGVSDVSDLISTIDNQVKPVYAYSDGMIASAAYWIGCSARSLDIGMVTEAGSIGVLVVHQENSKMLEDAGIKTTVIRSGKFKALGGSAEPLSKLAEETIQAQVDQLNGMFVGHVAQQRGTTDAAVEQKMGQGRVFIGQDAVDVGLADAVSNFDTFMSKVQGGIALQSQQSKYGGNNPRGTPLKNALTTLQIAALAAGGAVASLATPETDAVLAAEKTATDAVAAAKVLADAAEAAAEAAATKPVADSGVVALLQGQLAQAQAQVVSVSVELQASKTAAEASTSQAEKMRPVVRASVSNLRVALGGTSAGVDGLADDALMAEYANLSAQFGAKFKVGGVAAVSSKAAEQKDDGGSSELHQARIRATRSATK